ncbi:carboxypeptidase-like regulatory domain-containing protein [Flavobacterium gawalongense]|uniref:carboxypeptidase-like regulatory domain-containing protein n=1 Tax=Flavobacterium gawalongense TaxID=2594432 RepID=UPI001F275718|nr:carboxypeptidase-like regulatory domain-containing protein [Flavobacterium gawalongense]
MKNKIVILVLCLCCQFCFSQLTRKTLYGQVVNDSIKLENGIVFNVNSKTGTVINQQGFFSILAKVKDTLVFSGLTFKSKKIVLTQKEISTPLLRVKLVAFVNLLPEVVVYGDKKINPISGNSQKYVDMQYFDDEKSSPKNRTMPSDGSIEKGMDFVRIYKDVLKALRKNNPEKTDFTSDKSFTELVMNKVSYSFFTNTLKLNDDEIGLFLIFCENDSKSKIVMKPGNEFQVMDFLVTKNKEFKRITTFEK